MSARPAVENERASGPFSFEVVRPDILEKGGTVMVGLFKAGPEAEAATQLDRFSLTILSGIADVFSDERSPFQYVGADTDVPADLVIDGHIDEFRYPGLMNRVMLKRNIRVRISAEVRDIKTGQVVATIRVRQSVRNDRRDIDSAAYAVGIGIGRGLIK